MEGGKGINHEPNSRVPKVADHAYLIPLYLHASRVRREERTSSVRRSDALPPPGSIYGCYGIATADVGRRGRGWSKFSGASVDGPAARCVPAMRVGVGGGVGGEGDRESRDEMRMCDVCLCGVEVAEKSPLYTIHIHPKHSEPTAQDAHQRENGREESGHCNRHTYNTIKAGSCAGLVHGTASGNRAASRVACASLLVIWETRMGNMRVGGRTGTGMGLEASHAEMGREEKESLEEGEIEGRRGTVTPLGCKRVGDEVTMEGEEEGWVDHKAQVRAGMIFSCQEHMFAVRLSNQPLVLEPSKLNASNDTPTTGVDEFSLVYTWLPGAVYSINPSDHEAMSKHGSKAKSRDRTASKVLIVLPPAHWLNVYLLFGSLVFAAGILFWFCRGLVDIRLLDNHEGWIGGVG
ncbi:hypothetical protein BD779DRAFT_1476926 [Infundibulicybe gibba]|nr:hypothetical protein BD779DRAFT_1476926 [Infundibulicybe gibba]